MKHLYSILFLFGFLSIADAQIINFPDSNFKNYLLSSYAGSNVSFDSNNNDIALDANNDGQIQESEAAAIYHLRVNGTNLNITNVTGLAYFTNLRTFDIYYTDVTSLDLSPLTNLIYLSCNDNSLDSLNVTGLSNLKQLNCRDNNISTINFNTLTSIEDALCDNNSLINVDINGLLNLKQLYVGYNDITSINVQNSPQIFSFWCNNNFISSLEVNQLTGLTSFYCQDNLLTTIDVSALTNLSEFFFSGNHQLTNINMKNGSSQFIDYSIGLQNLQYVCADESEISNLQNIFMGNNYSVNVNSYCSFVPGGVFYSIQGNSKLDSNQNGCDSGDFTFPNLNLAITDGTNTANFISNTSGNYSIPVQAGTQTITPILENPTYYTISPTSFSVTFPTQSSPYIQNFCVSPNGVHNDLEVTILPIIRARPGFDATYKIVYKNKGTSIQSGSVTFSFEDDKVDFVTATPTISTQSDGLLSWDYSNLEPFESRTIIVTVNINSPMENPPVNIGDELDFTSIVNPLSGDEVLFDNTKSLKQVVVGSIDPNQKTCLEGDTVGTEMIGAYINYLIQFENTGTFAAENIVVKDMIDTTKFDIDSLIPINSSHSFVIRINDNKVEFVFENINLPFDDANNDGYVAFKIKTKPTLVVGDTFENKANIYFDYNFPVVTNTTSTTIQTLGNQNFDFSNYFSLYPNPAKGVLNIQVKNAILVYSVSIYNVLGQLLQIVTNPTTTIDVSTLKTGNYFVKLTTDKGTASSKFVKN